MILLENKVAIITGASSGIGRSAATLFGRHGAKLVVTARRKSELDELVCEIQSSGGEAVAIAGDIRSEDHVRQVTERAIDQFGRLDIALNNAGAAGVMAATPDLSLEDWSEAIATNLTSAFLCAKHQIPAMLSNGGGSIVFTSSFVGNSVGMPGMAAYAAAKAGIVGLTKVLAAEFSPRGIRINALLPGGTDTPGATMDTPETLAFVEGLHAMKRIARPDEIAESAMYLASNMSSFTTGSALYVDGGVSITRT